ncbi:isochorismatase family protein [Arthrobacter bambusae]|uniref:isochorismatase family protein n=1 Tax=Arthrobacter bambusae TaxID=1338426 RepID=UPI0035561FDA
MLSSFRGLNKVDTVIITGTLKEVCCESTARSAYMNDFKVAFVSDATGARSESPECHAGGGRGKHGRERRRPCTAPPTRRIQNR